MVDIDLERSKERNSFLINNILDVLVEMELNGVITYSNSRVYDLFGIKSEEIIGHSAFDFVHPADREEVQKQMKKSIKERNFFSMSFRVEHEKGFFVPVYANGTMSKLEGNLRIISVLKDVSELKEAENKLKEAFERENFYKDLFTHDINNILHIIQSSVSLLTLFQDNPEVLDEEIKEVISLLNGQIMRGSRLVANVRRLSELEHEEIFLEATEVRSILENAMKFVKEGYHDKEITINIKLPDSDIHVQANALLQDVFENILINAVKYTIDPFVGIDIHVIEELEDEKKYFRFEFIDYGIGIEDSRKEKIFLEGNKKDENVKGMGFGLSLVKKILESYGGKIWIEDRVKGDYSKGSNFVILIPIAKRQVTKEVYKS